MKVTLETSQQSNAQVRRTLAKLAKAYPEALGKALQEEALGIFTQSQERVPVDTGRLRASGGTKNTGSPLNPAWAIYYDTVYAVPVHERHSTKSLFLLGPFQEAASGMAERLAERTRRRVARDAAT